MKLWIEIEYLVDSEKWCIGFNVDPDATEQKIRQAFDAARDALLRHLRDHRAARAVEHE